MTTHPIPDLRMLQSQLNWATLIINPIGALLTFVYLSAVDPLPAGETSTQPLMLDNLIFLVVVVVVLILFGAFWDWRTHAPVFAWYQRVQTGTAPDRVPLEVQRGVLNYPLYQMFFNFVMWLLAGIIFGAMSQTNFWRTFIGVFGVGGVLSTPIVYFSIEAIWRQAVAAFFPEGIPGGVRAFRLTVLRRLLLVCLLISIWPAGLLAYLSLERARALLVAANPQVILDNFVLVVIFVLATTLITGIVMAVLMTRGLIGPIHSLQAAMARVERNDLDAQVMVTTNDELGYLGAHFNQMTAGLRQGELLRNLLNLYVSPEVAREAVEKGALLGGRAISCTVLFSDIRGFTSLSERMEPSALIDLLNQYMSAMIEVVTRNGGFVNKFGGDSLLAVFGTPLNPLSDHAACAVRTALDMRRALAEFNRAQAQAQHPTFGIGIGIATGQAVAGNVGGKGRLEYTVIGDTVNLAARLQDKTKELGGDVLLNAEAYLAAVETMQAEFEELVPTAIRGKQEPVRVFRLK